MVLCLITYGSNKSLRDPCSCLPTAARVAAFLCIFCLPNIMITGWLLLYGFYGENYTALEEHVRVLYLLFFLEMAPAAAAQGVLRQIKQKHLNTADIDLWHLASRYPLMAQEFGR